MSLRCPKCPGSLRAIKPGPKKVVIDACGECHGFWLDENEIYSLAKDEKAFWDFQSHGLKSAKPSSASCPRCSVKLFNGTLPGFSVEVDNCPSCNGLFFDAGELEEVTGKRIDWVEPKRLADFHQLKKRPCINKREKAVGVPKTINSILEEGEEVFWFSRPDLLMHLGQCFFILIMATVFFASLWYAGFFKPQHLGLFSFAAFFVSLTPLFNFSNTYYALTNQRVILLHAAHAKSLPYEKINFINASCDPIQSLLGLGHVSFTVEKKSYSMKNIMRPVAIYKTAKEIVIESKTASSEAA